MTIQSPVQLPIQVNKAEKRDIRCQFAALVYRVNNDKVEVLLITSRNSRRWIIPKGWPMLGLTPAEAAATEAWEEAGVTGKTSDQCLGIYSYMKTLPGTDDLPCAVMVYSVKAKKLANRYPEADQRRRKWFSRKKAAKMVAEPELAKLIKTFDPRRIH